MFTVLGASGFIGSHLVAHLRAHHQAVTGLSGHNGDLPDNLGHAICCVGLTADFRTRPLDTMEAHVSYLLPILRECAFDSFTYLSSTRVYGHSVTPWDKAREDNPIHVQTQDPDQLYNISKLAGESVCLSSRRPNVRVARLSNVYGYDSTSENFVFALIKAAVRDKLITLHIARASGKDHISVFNVVKILTQISEKGQQRIYNVASGHNTQAGQVVDKIQEITGCRVVVDKDAPVTSFPMIDTSRVEREFGFKATDLLDDLEPLVQEFEIKETATR